MIAYCHSISSLNSCRYSVFTNKENTMNRRILILFIMLFCVILSAQSEVWLWANGAGGASSDRGRAIATDALGNCYTTGSFVGTVTFGTTSLASSGSDDIFIAKLDTYGNWIWVKKAGGAGGEDLQHAGAGPRQRPGGGDPAGGAGGL